MKGLLIKDYRLLLGQKQFLTMVIFLGVLYLALYNDPTFAIMFITLMCGIFAISTISYDDQNNGLSYLFTLPVSKKEYVLEKYIFVIVNSIISGVVMFFGAGVSITVRRLDIPWNNLCMALISAWLVVMLVIGYMIPLQLKFGAEKSRIVLMSGMAAIFLGVYFIVKITKGKGDWGLQLIDRLEDMSDITLVILILIVTTVVTVISIAIAMKVMEKREF